MMIIKASYGKQLLKYIHIPWKADMEIVDKIHSLISSLCWTTASSSDLKPHQQDTLKMLQFSYRNKTFRKWKFGGIF